MAEPNAAVAILHAREPADSVLLIRRAEREGDPWSGHWSFPGGRRDPGDRDLLHTALRELREECAVDVSDAELEVALAPSVAGRTSGPVVLVAPYVFHVNGELPATPDLHEAVEARWVPLRLLRDPAQHRLSRIPGLPENVLFPSVALPGMPLWGFTYRVIAEWLGLLPERPELTAFIRSRLNGARTPEHVYSRLTEEWEGIPPLTMVEVLSNGLRASDLDFHTRWIAFD